MFCGIPHEIKYLTYFSISEQDTTSTFFSSSSNGIESPLDVFTLLHLKNLINSFYSVFSVIVLLLSSYEKRIDTFRIPNGYHAFAIENESIFSLFLFIAKIFELMRDSVMPCLVDHCHTLSLAFQIVYLGTKSLQIKR